MQSRKRLSGLSGFSLLVGVFAAAKFLVHILTGQNGKLGSGPGGALPILSGQPGARSAFGRDQGR